MILPSIQYSVNNSVCSSVVDYIVLPCSELLYGTVQVLVLVTGISYCMCTKQYQVPSRVYEYLFRIHSIGDPRYQYLVQVLPVVA